MIKGSIHPEDIAILNLYATNNRVTKYIKKQINKKNKFIIIIVYFKILYQQLIE